MLMATRLGRVVSYHKRLQRMKSSTLCSRGIERSRDNLKNISPTKVPNATKLGKMLTYLDRPPLIQAFINYNFWYTRFRARKTVLCARPCT